MRTRTFPQLIITFGYLGMMVYFGCLVIYDGVKDSPSWLVYPAFGLMLIGVPLDIVQRIRHRHR